MIRSLPQGAWPPKGETSRLPCTQLTVQLEKEKLLAKLLKSNKGEVASESEGQGKDIASETKDQDKGQAANVSTDSASTLDCAIL